MRKEFMMKYSPKPIDTTNITISDELLALTEKIAENVHDVWARWKNF